jgi:hypothetical protein
MKLWAYYTLVWFFIFALGIALGYGIWLHIDGLGLFSIVFGILVCLTILGLGTINNGDGGGGGVGLHAGLTFIQATMVTAFFAIFKTNFSHLINPILNRLNEQLEKNDGRLSESQKNELSKQLKKALELLEKYRNNPTPTPDNDSKNLFSSLAKHNEVNEKKALGK